MSPEVRFFLTESVRYARSLPYVDCLKYLRGLLVTCGDTEEVAEIRELVRLMDKNDQQLELIASGQLKLGFDSDTLRPDRHRRPGRKGTE